MEVRGKLALQHRLQHHLVTRIRARCKSEGEKDCAALHDILLPSFPKTLCCSCCHRRSKTFADDIGILVGDEGCDVIVDDVGVTAE